MCQSVHMNFTEDIVANYFVKIFVLKTASIKIR